VAAAGQFRSDLARTGKHASFASIEQAIVDEGYAETVPWLEWPGVVHSLNEICFASRPVEKRV
jgi:hypothetical protein